MPTYRYRCKSIIKARHDEKKDPYFGGRDRVCNHEYDVFYTSIARMEAEEPGEACESCGGLDKERLIVQTGGHILKGKGWFKDGY
jgi:predicted nucleic acid-binding Zn ribbon protein